MNSIEDILSELYAIDPSFKRHEADLRSLVKRLRLAKPDFSIDDAFVRRLRSDILYSGKPKPVSFLIRSYFIQTSKNLFRSSAFGMAIALVLLVPIAYTANLYQKNQSVSYKVDNASVSLGEEQEISYKPQNAFGVVALTATTSPALQATPTPNFSSIIASSTMSAIFATSTATTTPPAYIFNGSAPTLSQPTANVLETDTSSAARSELLANIQNLGFELSDMTSIADANDSVGTIEVQESKPFGYIVTMNLNKMTITISKNPASWPDESNLPLTTNLNATDTINIALIFLKQHNINTLNYGPATLVSENSASSTATVLLPLIINHQNVFNTDGSSYGINISVDQKLEKVTAVTGITLQKYTASAYPVETNFTNILNILDASNATTTATTTTATVASTTPELGTPASGLIHYIVNDNEFFVPGLIFPVASSTELVTVPLLKNTIEK